MRFRRMAMAIAVMLTAFAVTPASVRAQEVNFSGGTKGCYVTVPAVTCTPAGASAFDAGGLEFDDGLFHNTTFHGVAGYGTGTHGTFGGFTTPLGVDYAPSVGEMFLLEFTFTSPTAPTTLYSAFVTGAVALNGDGNIFIDFGGPVTFAFTDGGQSGTAVLQVNDVNLGGNGDHADITGQITGHVTATPEPASLALMATGVVSLGGFVRRRKRQNQNLKLAA